MQLAPALPVRFVPVILFLTLFSGCGSVRLSPSSPANPVPDGASSVYVLQQGNPYLANPTLSYVLQFSTVANGAKTPVSTLSLPTAFVAYSIALDSAGQIYVGGYQGSLDTTLRIPEILVYAPNPSGAPEPLFTMKPQGNGLPVSMAVDNSGQLYVANSGPSNIAVYSSGVNGPATPIQLIEGTLTQINTTLLSLAVDATGNIYATTQTNASTPSGLLLVFSPSANGNAAPSRAITNESGVFFYGVAVDSSLNVFATEESATGKNAAIVEFAAGASGNATPIRSISGPATAMSSPGGLRRDNAGNLYTVNALVASTSIAYSLLGFNSVASGNIQPNLQFSSAEWTSAAPELALR